MKAGSAATNDQAPVAPSIAVINRLDELARQWLERGDPARALALRRVMTLLQPDHADLHCNFGAASAAIGQRPTAARAYFRALAIQPDHQQALFNLAALFHAAGRLEIAIPAYRGLIAAAPQIAGAYDNLGLCRAEMSGLVDSSEDHRRAFLLDRNSSAAALNRVTAALYRPGVTLASIAAAARDAVAGMMPKAPALPVGGERPRLGFVSGDFRNHAVGHMVLPTIERLAARGSPILCYMTSDRSDHVTERFRRGATVWRKVSFLSDQDLAAQIAADGIDILFDLSGYTLGNRLTLFARRAAPLQIAWAGFPATTGLAAMDYLLGDRFQLPSGVEPHYAEKLIRLPHGYIAFAPPDEELALTALPAVTRGFVTFGSFNGAKKLTRQLVTNWSQLLAALPSARLMLKAEAFSLPGAIEAYRAAFTAHGIAADRLTFLGSSSRSAHMRAMADCDIALDSFPYSGGQTTLELLWSGIPVITCPGETIASRHSGAYLQAIGLDRLIAENLDHYRHLALALARDLPRLAELRASMRQRILASPLADLDHFGDQLQQVLQAVFVRHRHGLPATHLAVAPDGSLLFAE